MPRAHLIQHRRGTAAEWASANPVLAAGEPGFETDTRQEKRGDGVTAWVDLDYLATDEGASEIADIDGLQEALDAKADAAATTAALAGKANSSHTHAQSDVTGLTAALALLQPIAYDAFPDTNLTASGPLASTLAAGATIAAGECVRLASNGKWALIDADAEATSTGLLAIALESKVDTQAMLVALPGSFVRNDAWAWNAGATLYLSTTPGALTETQPSGTDDVIRVVGFAITADVIYFSPSPDYITHT